MRILIVDGYNVAHAWPQTKALLDTAPLEDVRRALIASLAEYAAVAAVKVTVVFDGPRRAGGAATPPEEVDGVTVRFSGDTASADHLIERLAYEATRAGRTSHVVVVTSDRLQRALVRAMGVDTMDARTLGAEVAAALADTAQRAARSREAGGGARRLERHLAPDVYAHLERLRRGADPEGDDAERQTAADAGDPGHPDS